MKKIIYAILGISLLFQACANNDLPTLDENPYRTTVDYLPGTQDLTVKGTLTPDESYDWITLSQSGDKATFTFRRNTTGKVRTAVYTMSGSSYKAKVFQKAHSLDATVEVSVYDQSLGSADVGVHVYTENSGDYESWGVLCGTSSDVSKAKEYPQSGKPAIGLNLATITGLEEGTDYYLWGYVKSTEGDQIVSDLTALISPVYVQSGDDLQAAIDGAKEFAEIRVQGGVTFPGGIKMMNNNANKTISGGWNSDFTSQSIDNLTVIDGQQGRGFWCAGDEDDNPLNAGYVNISYFEIKNCKGDHGSAIHACGGPVTIHHCDIHDNNSEKGAIGTKEEDFSTTITVYDCKVHDNYADGHGAAFGFGDGVSDSDYVHATLVNNLIANNISTSYDGYCSAFICYSYTELIFVNNTVIGNCNYEEGADDPNSKPYEHEYPGLNLRGSVISLFANNLIVGNKTSLNTTPANYYPMKKFIGFGGGQGSFVYNIYEGEGINESGNATISDNKFYEPGFDISSVVTAAYQPTGAAVGFGTLGTITFQGKLDDTVISDKCDISKLLGTYSTDLAGNPRVVNGQVDAGCYQSH